MNIFFNGQDISSIKEEYQKLCDMENNELKTMILINKDEEYIINFFKSHNIEYSKYNDPFSFFLVILKNNNNLNISKLDIIYKKILLIVKDKNKLTNIKNTIIFTDKYNINNLNDQLNKYSIPENIKNDLFAIINIINTNNYYIKIILCDISQKEKIICHNNKRNKYAKIIEQYNEQTRKL